MDEGPIAPSTPFPGIIDIDEYVGVLRLAEGGRGRVYEDEIGVEKEGKYGK